MFVLGAVFALSFGLLLVRAVFLHVKDNSQLENLALRQYRTAVRQSSYRGKIIDINGEELAVNLSVYSIFANPHEIPREMISTVADKLSSLLELEKGKLIEKLSQDRKFVWLRRLVSDDVSKKIKDMELPGIDMLKENKRSYPNGKLLSQVLGAVGFDSKPLGGVELGFNDYLVSHPQKNGYLRDARGYLFLSPSDLLESEPSGELQLTIDKQLQYILEKELSLGVERTQAKSGVAVVLDPLTGDILAIANMPDFDPNRYNEYSYDAWRNRSITDPYEPGSTFKAMTIASAMDMGVVKENDVFDCENGQIQVDAHLMRDTHPYGKLKVSEIIKYSSNIGAYKISKLLGKNELYEKLLGYGFGEKTDVMLPGESGGILASPRTWSELQFANIAFGQGIALTPLQMSVAFAAIINGGELLKPRIVKRILDENGNEIKAFGREVVARSISAKTSEIMRELLRAVVEPGGTGTLASTPEYTVGGKTGTAQKVDFKTGKYKEKKYFSSFVGFAPVEAPRVVIYVGIDEPRGVEYYGGQVAAPIFRKIVEKALHYLKVPSQLGTRIVRRGENDIKDYNEGRVAQTINVEITEEGRFRVPDLKGLTKREILAATKDVNLDVDFSGSGFAVKQFPSEGDLLKPGERLQVVFRQHF
ncbi:MAG: penicillin-binding protein [Pseudomonadota bacterium]